MASSATNILCIHIGSLDTKILYIEPFQKFFSYPSVSFHPLQDFIFKLVAKVKIFITLGDFQDPHVCVIQWVSSELVQGLL